MTLSTTEIKINDNDLFKYGITQVIYLGLPHYMVTGDRYKEILKFEADLTFYEETTPKQIELKDFYKQKYETFQRYEKGFNILLGFTIAGFTLSFVIGIPVILFFVLEYYHGTLFKT